MKKLCYVATVPAVVHAFLRNHIQAAAGEYQVTVVCNSADKHLLNGIEARIVYLDIVRKPALWRDMRALFALYRLFRCERFDIVHSIMPKTGMLAMMAASLAKVPVRLHTFTGQIWVTKRGIRSTLLKQFDRLIGYFATCTLADSPSQRDFLVSEGVLAAGKVEVIGAGSICGVDPVRFRYDARVRHAIREALGIAQDAKVILFVGRLNRDKGMLDLAAAFNTIAGRHRDAVLLLVGAEEEVSFGQIQEICCAAADRLRYVSFTSEPEQYMTVADVFCLPSYREGFGMTIIEAAACGVPAVATRIYGITDAVDENITGLLFPAGDVDALTLALTRLITEHELREQMGYAARERAITLFSSRKITLEMLAMYDRLYKEQRGRNGK